jgi:hypothetical protein
MKARKRFFWLQWGMSIFMLFCTITGVIALMEHGLTARILVAVGTLISFIFGMILLFNMSESNFDEAFYLSYDEILELRKELKDLKTNWEYKIDVLGKHEAFKMLHKEEYEAEKTEETT